MRRFLDRIAARVVVGDGAMGTALQAAGHALDVAPPTANLADPDLVRDLHASYVDAGSEVIQTNTFGASRLRLAPFGYDSHVVEINTAGVEIARAAAALAARDVLVAGSVSPPVRTDQRSSTSAAERVAALREQMDALDAAGVDLLVLETFGYLDELVEAVGVAAEHVHLPVVAQATFRKDGRMLSGHSPLELAHALADTPAAMLGVNCTLGPQGTLRVVTELARHTDRPLSAQPNAGVPRRVSGTRLEFEVAPEYFARYAERLAAAGVVLIGGCCGTTPLHVMAIAKTLEARPAAPVRVIEVASEPALPQAVRLAAAAGPILVAELVPSADDSAESVLATAEALRGTGVKQFAVAAVADPRAQHGAPNRSVDLAALLQDRLNVPAAARVTTWNRSIMALQAHLLGAQARGVSRILCETGSPLLLGDYPAADGTWEVDSIGLIELLAALNDGFDHHGLPIASGTAFEICGRVNPGAHDLLAECERARRKVDAGVQLFLTGPVFGRDGLLRLLDAINGAVPVLATLRPLTGFADAEFLHYEVPDVTIPDDVLTRMERGAEDEQRVGIEIAAELAAEIRDDVRGLVLRTNFRNSAAVLELAHLLAGPAT
jgi:methionine synthase / methylenetetrahydrofolate reductase (NADH)